VARHAGIHKFPSCANCRGTAYREIFAKIPSLPLLLEVTLSPSLPKIYNQIGEDRKKDRFENWQCAVFESSRFVTTEWETSCKTASIISIRVSIAFYHISSLVNTTQCTWTSRPATVYCRLLAVCLGFPERHSTSVFLVLIFIPNWVARSGKPIKCMLKTLFRGCKQYQIVRQNQKDQPAASNSNSAAVTVYLIHSYAL